MFLEKLKPEGSETKTKETSSNKSDLNNNNKESTNGNSQSKPQVNKNDTKAKTADQSNSNKPVKKDQVDISDKESAKPKKTKTKVKERPASKGSSSSEESAMKRRSSTPPSLSSSFKILPPIQKEIEEDRPVESYDFKQEEDLSDFCQLRLRNFSSRTLDLMLLELRKMDRDREKIIHPATVENLVHKYNVPITPCIDTLLDNFEDKTYGGLVNYEDLMQYLQNKRQISHKKDQWPHIQDYFEKNQQPRNQTVTITKGRTNPRQDSPEETPKKKLQRSKSWTDERENDLLRGLNKSLADQKVDVDRLSEILHSKDHYGNGQVSNQQIQDSLRQLGVNFEKSLVIQWMKSADMIGRGIYSIPVLIETMKLATNNNVVMTPVRSKRKHMSSSESNLHKVGKSQPVDNTWRHILDLNSSLPRQKSKSSSDDREVRLKNVMRLKSAMYSSYNQHQV